MTRLGHLVRKTKLLGDRNLSLHERSPCLDIFVLKIQKYLKQASIPYAESTQTLLSRQKIALLFCWETGNRTPIKSFKGFCPTVRRSPNVLNTLNL